MRTKTFIDQTAASPLSQLSKIERRLLQTMPA